MVAAAICAALALVTGGLAGDALRWGEGVAGRNREQAALDELTARWQSEADTAWAIYAQANELQFYRRDGLGRPHVSTYTSPVAGAGTFSAQTYDITALQNPSSPIYNPLYAGAVLRPVAVQFAAGALGGNALTAVTVASEHYVRAMLLTTRTAPSGFTVVLRYTPPPSPTPSAQPSGIRFGWQGRHEENPGAFDTGANYQVYANWYVSDALLAGTWSPYCTQNILNVSPSSTTTSNGNCDGYENTQTPSSPPPGVLGP